MPSYQPRIAVVGGGPSGLTVALLLHKQNIAVTVFELRARPTEEDLARPAGMLDLHEESGLAALKECNLMDEFQSHTGVCAEFQVLANKKGEIIYTDKGGQEYRPEISRNSLTRILLDQLPLETIKWEHKLVSTTRSTSAAGATEIELDFGANGKHTFDFVVGADGTWSRIRNLLTNTKPTYFGYQVITVTIREVTAKYPDIAEYTGPGSFMALGQKHGIMSQRALQDSARIYVFLTTPDENFRNTSGLVDNTAAEAKDKLLNDDALLANFGPKLKKLVQVACDEETKDNPDAKLDIMPLFTLPIGHTWAHQPGATVIGDASHVMGPFAGEGVNLAMWDALELSQAIIQAHKSTPQDALSFHNALDPLVAQFEAGMAERAKDKAEETWENSRMMFGTDDTAPAVKDWFLQAMAGAPGVSDAVKVFSE